MNRMHAAVEESVSVGLDVHQHIVQVCVLNRAGEVLANRRVPNDDAAILAAILMARGVTPVRGVALECGTGTAALAEALIRHTGWDVQPCHPGYVRRMKQNPDKTDFGDARVLADLVRVGYVPRVWLAPPAVRDLRQLVRYRQQIVDRQRNTKLRIRALLREHRVPVAPAGLWTRAGRAWLDRLTHLPPHARWVLTEHVTDLENDMGQVARITARLREVAAADEVIQALRRQAGIGLVTACVLRAEVGDFRRFHSGKQLARFCGLSPCNASSGARQADAGLIRGCSRLLRDSLIEAAHRLTRCDPTWKAFKEQMQNRGKAGSLIAAAVANRWLRRLYHELYALNPAA